MQITLSELAQKKKDGRKITALTAYDAPFARIIDQAGIDIIVVNDGVVGAIAMGRDESFSPTIDEINSRYLRSHYPQWIICDMGCL